MKRQVWIFGVLLVLFVFVTAQSSSNAYEVESYVGSVFYSANGKEWQPLDVGMRFSKNYWIKTGVDSSVMLVYEGKRSLQVLQNTVIQLKSLGTKERVRVKQGAVHLNVFTKLKKGEVVEVENDVAVAAVRGTKFIIDYVEGDVSTCAVLEGTVTLTRQVQLTPEVSRDPEIANLLTVQVKANQKLSMTMAENKALEELIRRSKNNLAQLKEALSESQRQTLSRVMAIKNAERVLEELRNYDEDQSETLDDTEDTVNKIKQKVK